MKIIRGRLSAADVSNPSVRYNADCDCIQVTPDGGTTWNNDPGLDPRHSSGLRKPPVGGSDQKCDAAANKTKWLKDFIDQVIEALVIGGTAATLINVLLDFIDLLFPGAALLELLIEIADEVFGIGAVALTGAFSSTEYDLLKCIFFCRADAQGSVSAAQLAAVEADVTAQLNTTAALVTNLILSAQGEVGLSNAGTIGGQTGDCLACACAWCHTIDFTVEDGGGTASLGAWTDGVGWEAGMLDGGAGNAYTYIDLEITIPTATFTLTEVRWAFVRVDGSFDATITDRQWSPTGASANWYATSIAGATVSPWIVDPNLSSPATIGVTISSGYLAHSVAKSGNVTITRLTIYGTGDNPYDESNC